MRQHSKRSRRAPYAGRVLAQGAAGNFVGWPALRYLERRDVCERELDQCVSRPAGQRR